MSPINYPQHSLSFILHFLTIKAPTEICLSSIDYVAPNV